MTKQTPPLKKWQIVALGVAGVLIAVIVTVGAISEKNAPTTPIAATAEASAEPAASEPEPEPEPAEPESDEALTVENNEDLAALLAAVEDYDLFKEFAATYQGSTIEFDGIVAAMNQHGDYKTRYDILIFAGDNEVFSPALTA